MPAATNGRQIIISATDLLRVALTEHSPNTFLPPHSHDIATITIVLGGDYQENIGDGDTDLPSMAVVVKPSRTCHSNRVAARGARCLLVEFSERAVDELKEVGNLFPRARTVDLTRAADVALQMLAKAAEPLVLEELSMGLIGTLSDELCSRRSPPAGAWLDRVRDRLHEDDSSQLTLRGLSNATGYHPVYVARAFKRRFGESIGSYRQRLRLSRAAREVAQASGRSLSEIAHQQGYHDHSHMSHDFRMRARMTPAEWRALSAATRVPN